LPDVETKERRMESHQSTIAETSSTETLRRPYSPPRLEVHGTVQDLTHDISGGQGGSAVDDA
jgi:hypothetical protein